MGLRRVEDGWQIGSEGTQIVSEGSQMSGMVSNGEVSGLGLGFAWSDRLGGIKLEISSEPAWLWESWGLTWNTLKFVYLLIFCRVQRTFDKFLWAAAVTICSAEQQPPSSKKSTIFFYSSNHNLTKKNWLLLQIFSLFPHFLIWFWRELMPILAISTPEAIHTPQHTRDNVLHTSVRHNTKVEQRGKVWDVTWDRGPLSRF